MKVLVAAGGTGGHVYPALAVVEELRANGALSRCAWVGNPHGLEQRAVALHPWIEFLPLSSRGIDRRRPWTWPLSFAQTLTRVVRALVMVRRFDPDVVLGTGGHAAFAPLVAAWLLGIPTAIHEQNVRMGLSNRLLARRADVVLLSYPTTRGVPRQARVQVIGNPVRRSVRDVPRHLGEELLVVGGSLGSRRLVEAMVQVAPELAQTPGLRMRVVVGQAAPVGDVTRALAEAGVPAEVVQYAEPFAEALSRARLVVARAGATTVAEVAAAGRPAVFVPWDGATDRHQHDNAWAMAQAGGCRVVTEDAVARDLGGVVRELWNDDQRLRDMAFAARAAARPDAARLAAQALIALVEGARL
ncbi:MAG: UDP-N-acetylglucosamine--N-acetylmuramyl-(pentapeptide) pyrophosphoryl-undecaprenol N-acetylglucosamine transferase [Candidatus Bipolaricaulis sibiricus]|uniref:UDP-N-acetylglucosamine--N-acetylmuramyl-(pentapeptide) pyrophosphoryl-undecaprenol N-acetylglucosamine transferase n=1 Tax=Bipolaricaulis sibiricus TaxID=2501609 RepID=A0A410FW88_BIPS1|nr:MAG: UDP-N-acetylglucosamine--N-acetylmuramyl-(pentapeptide) pyrophosphoryl-undecaprenol N-acetylglucosamine transferase [Candidatus Bipolaricaulis sibiricus]